MSNDEPEFRARRRTRSHAPCATSAKTKGDCATNHEIRVERHAHWANIYQTKSESEVSWFQESPAISVELIHATGITVQGSIIDIGGGVSRLVDALVEDGYEAITVLDLSKRALATSKVRLGVRAAKVTWIAGDVTAWEHAQSYDVWHDRAVFHFLTDPKDRAAYVERLLRAVRPSGHVIIATFALDGPERCSGLPVIRPLAKYWDHALN